MSYPIWSKSARTKIYHIMSHYMGFSRLIFNNFIKNPQTTIALPFFKHNISAIGGVKTKNNDWKQLKTIYILLPVIKSSLGTFYVILECVDGKLN